MGEDAETPKKTRIQLDFSPKMVELLDRLQVQCDMATRAEVIRWALSRYGLLVDAATEGKRVEFVSKNGKERERLILP